MKERLTKAPKLRLILTAGVGSDHIDLAAAATHNVTVEEITCSNVVSMAGTGGNAYLGFGSKL